MFIDRLLNQGNMPLLEQSVRFMQARSDLLGEDIANLSTPNYREKDLSVERFQQILREKVENPSEPDETDPVAGSEDENGGSRTLLFHDRNNRSVEQLMSDHAQTALMHNLMIELLRKQFSEIQEAIKERPT